MPTHPVTPARFSLHHSWEFGRTSRRPFDAPDVFDRDSVQTWLPARVPGNVRLDLLSLAMIPDPFRGEQYRGSAWVDSVDWWYRAPLPADLPAGGRVFLRFHGVDYRSAVFVNGREMNRHEGMFSRQTIEITDALTPGGGEVAVRLWGSDALPRRRLNLWQKVWAALGGPLQRAWGGVYPDRTATLKMQMGFGWDFAPRILTTGIWDEVEVIVTGDTFIRDCQIRLSPEGEGIARLTLDTRRAESIPLTLTLAPHNFEGAAHRFPFTLPPRSGLHTVSFRLEKESLKLWHPWDRGFPHLYTLTAEIPGSDRLTVRCGARSVELRDWQLRVNGQREFVRGLNWVPADVFPGRITDADYADLLGQAKACGANLIRVWGGGLREKRDFYALCDSLGLMVWQEFPFACLFLGTYPRDARFLSLAAQEVAEIVRQLDSHPSVVVWCGGNEFSPRRNRPLVQAIARAAREAALSPRPFLPASPSPGDAHNWLVWHGFAPLREYRREKAAMLSEFGLQALPARETLEAVLPNPSTGWATHHGQRGKLFHYLRGFLSPGGRQTLNDWIAASQRAQATGLQIAIEHMRRRKGETGGVIVWQFNEPWPAISWALVDYFRRPKLAFQRLKAWWYRPLLVSLDFEPGRRWRAGDVFRAAVWGVNDSGAAAAGDLTVALDGTVIFSAKGVTLPPDSSVRLGEVEYRLAERPSRVTVRLSAGEAALASNEYDLSWRDARAGKLLLRLRQRITPWLLR